MDFIKKNLTVKRLLIAIILVAGFFIYQSANSGDVVEVQEIKLTQTIVSKSISASGEIKSLKEASMSFPSIGRVQVLNVEKGEEVKQGAFLAQLFASDTFHDIQALKDARDIAKRDKELFVETYETKRNAVSGFDEYAIEVRRLDEYLSRAEATYQSSLASLSNKYIYAPFDGTVTDIFVEIGESAVTGGEVLRIADLNQLVFEADLDQEDFGLVKVGQNVEIILDSYENTTFTGEVMEIPLYADGANQDFVIKIKVNPNEEYPILLGMTGDINILIDETPNEVNALIFDNVLSDESGEFVWGVYPDTKALYKRYIEIGLEGDLYTEIVTDVSGETIVVSTDDDVRLTEGTTANIKE